MGIFPDDAVRQKHNALTLGRQVVERTHRHINFVANTMDIDEQLRGRLEGQYSGEATDHGLFFEKLF
jgi:hypothetical protein